MSEKFKNIVYCLAVLFMVGVGMFSIIRANRIVSEHNDMYESVVEHYLYLDLPNDDEKSLEIIETVKSDYYFKVKETGYWKMITNEQSAIEDGIFIVTLTSYPGDKNSEEYTNRFYYYLTSWFKFKELEDDWSLDNNYNR